MLTGKDDNVGRKVSNGSLWTNELNPSTAEPKPPSKVKLLTKKLEENLDLDLLNDFTYLIIALGCGLIYVSESNFKLMAPFFLADIGE